MSTKREVLLRYRVVHDDGVTSHVIVEQRDSGRVYLLLEEASEYPTLGVELTPGLLQELRRTLGKI